MRTSTPDWAGPGDERGFASIQYVVAATFALWFFAVLANLIVVQYAVGVVRLAIDEGARAGAVAGSGVADCRQAVAAALADLLGGPYGEGVAVECSEEPGWMRVSARARFAGFVPPVPDLTFGLEAGAAREGAP
jgi:hypothetical protein